MAKVFQYVIKANGKTQKEHCLDCAKFVTNALIERGAIASVIDLATGETVYGNNFTQRYTKAKR